MQLGDMDGKVTSWSSGEENSQKDLNWREEKPVSLLWSLRWRQFS